MQIKYKLSKISQKQITFILICITLMITIIVFFGGIKHFFYVYIIYTGLFISYYLLAGTEDLNIISICLFSFLLGAGILVLISGLLALVGILITRWVLLLPPMIIIFLLLKYPLEIDKVEFKISPTEWVLFLFAILSFTSRVVSIKGYAVPILHDPISHATWSKEIYDTGLINYFYSPGLHILSALGMMVDKVNVATYVLRLTNLFNAFTFIPVYYLLKQTFKNKTGALLGATIFLIAPLPTNFFWLSGKNGLVTALPYLFLLLYSLQLEMPFGRKALFSNALIFVLILAHYPVAAISLIFAVSLLLAQKKIKGFINIVIGIVLGLSWGLIKMKYQAALDAESIKTTLVPITLTARNILIFIKDTLNQAVYQYKFTWSNYFTYIGIIGLSLTLIIKKLRRGVWLLISLFLSLLVSLVINFTPLRDIIHLLYKTKIITFFVYIYLGFAILLVLINEIAFFQKPLLVAIQITTCILLVVMNSMQTFSTYREEQSKKNMVSGNDIAAFNWINENLGDDCHILNNAAKNNRSYIVYASDGAAWIPVFTDCEIAMPFTEFSSVTTHQNFEYYSRLLDGTYTCEDISRLIEQGIFYYYKDSQGVYGPQLNPDELVDNFNKVYEGNGVKIYSIVPCSP